MSKKGKEAKGPGLGPLNTWVDVSLTLDGAIFNGMMAGGADFRINCNGDGNELVHRVIVQ